MTPLDISTIGKARGLLDNASSATAHGDHKDAIGYARQALDLLASEVSGQLPIRRGTNGFGSSSEAKADPLVAAKERLGAWLAVEPSRVWHYGEVYGGHGNLARVEATLRRSTESGYEHYHGEGDDLASALLSALLVANGGDRG